MSAQHNKSIWAGRILSGLVALFLLIDAIMKLLQVPIVTETSAKLGYPPGTIFNIGIVLLVCTLIYLVPQTMILGAILLTAYLGGATATHVRVGTEVFPIFFPGILGALLWAGVYLRDGRLRALIPLRSS
jgi:hypothetical protein